jgi:hypothetical protein
VKIEGEWQLNPSELAALFKVKSWAFLTSRGIVTPTDQDIEQLLTQLISDVATTDHDMIQRARFLIWKAPELPGSYDLWLNIGYIWDADALGAERVAT